MYLSIVQPHFSYCCSVLGCCGATKLKALQKLQNRAAGVVTSSPFDTPAAPLLQLLRWLSIEKLITRETCTMMYESLNDLAPENLGNIFYKLSDVHTRVLSRYEMQSCSAKDENCLWPKIICVSWSEGME